MTVITNKPSNHVYVSDFVFVRNEDRLDGDAARRAVEAMLRSERVKNEKIQTVWDFVPRLVKK